MRRVESVISEKGRDKEDVVREDYTGYGRSKYMNSDRRSLKMQN